MIINYNSLSRGRDAWLKNDVGDLVGSPPGNLNKASKKTWLTGLLFVFLLLSNFMTAQTTLISPTGDGGFETGTTLAANGWTAVNATTDGWVVGATPVVATGSRCGFVSANSGTSWTYSQISTFTHIYRDFTIPAGESKVTLSFKWKAGGEGTTTSDWDNLKVFVAPNTVTPTTSAAVSGGTQLIGPGAVSGMYKLSSASWNSETITFVGTPGTTYRLFFSWKSDISDIANPPAALDDISLVSSAPGNYTSVATGNWSAPATWGGSVPSLVDNVTIADGHTVTIDAAGQGANNLTVGGGTSGTLTFGSTPSSFVLTGNLGVNAGATFNAFNSTTGKTVTVGGNIVNNGTMNFSVGTSVLALNGTSVQTVGGTGAFTSSLINTLTFNNTNATIPNINWNPSNISVATLNFTSGKVALGASNRLTLGTSVTAAGTLNYTAGQGFLNGKFNRYWTATGTGTSISAGAEPGTGNGTSRYPFLSATGQNRSAFIERGTALAAGQLSCTYVDAATLSTVSIADGAYTVEKRYDANWTFSTEGSGYAATNNEVLLYGTGAYVGLNGNGRILLAAAAAGGTHQAGLATPSVQRLMTVAQLTAGALYLGAANADISQPCTGTPTPGSIAVTSQTICANSTVAAIAATGYATGVTGITLQWQESDDNGVADAWADAVGGSNATTATYTPPSTLTATRYYRLKVTCTNTGLSDYTNAATINVNPCDYNVTRTTGITYNSIAATGTGLTGYSSIDDATSSATNIGFNFFYKGTTFTQFVVNTNGFIGLGSSTSSSFTNSLSSGTNIIAPFWDDLIVPGSVPAAQVGNSIKYKLDGSAPNRVLTVEWIGMEQYAYPGPNLNFQAKLYETSNKIEFVYGTMEPFNGTTSSSSTSAYSYSVGLAGSSGSGTNRTLALQGENTAIFSSTDPTTLAVAQECNVMYTFNTASAYSGSTSFAYTAPANDNPGGAFGLTVNPTPCLNLCGTYYTTGSATASPQSSTCGTAPDDDVWFTFVAPASGNVSISVKGATGFDAVVSLTDSAFTAVSGFGCVNATTGLSNFGLTETLNPTGLTGGATYYVRVSHNGTGFGSRAGFSICINEVSLPPANDNPCGAVVLTPSNSCTAYTDTSANSTTSVLNATTTTINGVVTPTCTGAAATVSDVWFKFTATSTTHGLTIDPVDGFDVAIQAYGITSGTCGTSDLLLTPLGCVNGVATGATEQVVFTTVAGTEYYIRVYRHPSGFTGVPVNNSQFSICVYNPIPACTTNTVPANLAVNRSLTPTLTWNASSYATSYDIYLGTASGPTTLLQNVLGNTTDTTFSYTLTAGQALNSLTQYFWYVVPKNANGAATCGAANETSFTTLNSCLTPTGLTVTALGNVTATVAWNAPTSAPANGYQYEVRTSGAAGSGSTGLHVGGTTVAGDTNENIVGLTAQTAYTLYVKGICSVSSSSDWSTGYVFTTTCNPITTLPHIEGFDAVALPSCWTSSFTGGAGWAPDDANDGVAAPRTGARFAGKSWSDDDVALLVSPPYNISSYAGAKARVNVWIYRSEDGLSTDRITFFANATNTLTGATQLIDIPLPITSAPTVATEGWYNYVAEVPAALVSNNFFVIARGTTSSSFSSYGIGFDDYALELIPPTISSFGPSAVCSQGGETVSIAGANFTGTTAVKFNGVDAVSFTVSPTLITAVTPAGLTQGYITVTNPIGTGTSATELGINPNPVVEDITGPDSVCLGEGTITLETETPSGLGVWSSSNLDVATVSSSGVVTPITEGTVTISFSVTTTGCTTTKSHVVTVNRPVEITSSTPTQTTTIGGSTSFSVVATGTGTPNLTYQWEISTDEGVTFTPITDDATFSGATTSVLSLTAIPAELNISLYQCIITGVCGPVPSAAAVLFVGETGIEEHPEPVTLCASGSGSASFTVEGSPDVTDYQWQLDPGGDQWVDVADAGIFTGSTTATLVLTGVTTAYNNYRFKCIVTGNGVAESNPALLTVAESANIDSNPVAQTVCYSGGTSVFTIAATGAVNYQWQYSANNGVSWNNVTAGTPAGATYSGASTASLTVNTTQATPVSGTHLYRAIVNSVAPCDNVESPAAQLVINNVSITGQPAPATIFAGNTGSFTVAATTGLPTTYQWQVGTSATGPFSDIANGTTADITYAGATSATLSVTTAQTTLESANRYYRAVVNSGTGCSLASNGVLLTTTTYCPATYANGPGTTDGITSVSLNTMTNASGNASTSPYYTFFTGVTVPNIMQQTTANVSVTYGSDSTQYGAVWIDFNRNGIFEASEGLVSGNAGASGTSVFAFNVPLNAVPGQTRMRVRGGNDSAITTAQACNATTSGYGETEDYIVNIVAIPTCSGNPVAGTVTPSASSVCGSGSVTLTATGYSEGALGLSYQWYNTVSGLISGATGFTYTTPVISTSTSYFFRVTCSSGGSTDTTPVTIGVNNPTITGTTVASRCGTGTVTLSATGSAAAVNWYSAATGGDFLFSGNNFTTPTLTTTTTYYASASTAPAAGTATVGTGTSLTGATDAVTAFNNRFSQYRAQYLFTASELRSAGVTAGPISSVGFDITTLGDGASNANFRVAVGNTANTVLTTTFATDLTPVYGPATYVHAVGSNTINFATPFNWDGTSNIIVEVSHSGANSTNNARTYYTTAANTVLYSVSASPTTGTLANTRPNITFKGNVVCQSARTAVVATVTAPPALTLSGASATICSGDNTTITVTSPAANFATYVWSPNTNVSGTAATGFTFNPTTTTAYTLTATTAGGCVNTATFNVTVNAAPTTPVISPATATICAGAIQALSIGNSSMGEISSVIGTGTTSPGTTAYPNPLSAYYGGVKHQMLFTAAELTALGLQAGTSITSISLNMNAAVASACTNFTIRMGTTANTALTGFVTGTSTVYGPTTYTPAAVGLAKFTLTTPYVWNGTSNLIVEMVHNAGNGGNGSGTRTLTTTTTANTVYYGAKDNVAGGIAGFDAETTFTSSGASALRPNTTFGYIGALAPTWSPTTGLYTDAAATVAYTGGQRAVVYAKPLNNASYTATVTVGTCPKTSVASVITVNQFYNFYVDADGDGHGTGSAVSLCSTSATTAPAGYSVNNTDCDDTQPTVYTGAPEILYDGLDNNCNGQLDEGFQLKTQLLAGSCGTTLASIGSLVQIKTINQPITGYRIRVTNGSHVQYLIRTVPHFTMNMLATYEYATTYTVEIELERNGTWLGYYGDPCLVSTPAVLDEGGATSVSPSQCGMMLPKITTLISTTSLPGVTGYRFRVTDITENGSGLVQVIDRNLQWFSLQMLDHYNYNATYRVEVAVKTTGDYSNYGSPCEVSSPLVPMTKCDYTATSGTDLITALSSNGVTQYRFQVTKMPEGSITTIDRNTHSFFFNQIPNYVRGGRYLVRVATMTKGLWSVYSDACTVYAPGATATKDVVASIEGTTFNAIATPNPFASDFAINVTTASDEPVQVKVYDMLGKLIESREVKKADLEGQKVGDRYSAGVYNVVVTQGANVKTLRVIKR